VWDIYTINKLDNGCSSLEAGKITIIIINFGAHYFRQLQFALQGLEELQADTGAASATAAVQPPTGGLRAALPHRHEPRASHDPFPHHYTSRHFVRVCNTHQPIGLH
jgi:hypothetical protein